MDSAEGIRFAFHVRTAIYNSSAAENIRVVIFGNCGNRNARICLDRTEARNGMGILCRSGHSRTDPDLQKAGDANALAQNVILIVSVYGHTGNIDAVGIF